MSFFVCELGPFPRFEGVALNFFVKKAAML